MWSDELASILFLWLAMLGAVVALRRGEHMRMTALVNTLGPRRRGPSSTLVAVAAALGFPRADRLAGVRVRARGKLITTPALEITNAWRAARCRSASA